MADQETLTKDELLTALRTSGREVVERLTALPEADLARGGYENGWNGREILAHIATIEWTYPRLIQLAAPCPRRPRRPGSPRRARRGHGAASTRTISARSTSARVCRRPTCWTSSARTATD